MKTKLLALILSLSFIGGINVKAQCSIVVDSVHQDCAVNCYGQIFTSVTGTPPFQYSWSNGDTLPNMLNACADSTYTIVITDSNGCVASAMHTMSSQLVVTITTTNVSCIGCCDGTAIASVTGGCPPYYFTWSNGNFSDTAINLCQGLIQVYVVDSCNCSIYNTGNVFYIVGINDIDYVSSFALFPNPFTTHATIKFSHELSAATLRVYNLFGQLMMEKNNISGNSVNMSRGNLGSGVYVYEVTDKGKKICTGKAVVY